MRALIADDDRDFRALVVRALRKDFAELEAMEIMDAASLAKALDGAEPAFLITDLDLRWTDGLAIFRKVRERFPYCAAIMLTASGSEEKAVEAVKQGFDDYIVKRRDRKSRLGPSVRDALARQQQRRELKITKDDLLAAVEEKEVLLKELCHRTANNLQLVITLNLLAADRFTDPAARAAIGQVNGRIAALAMLQEKFY